MSLLTRLTAVTVTAGEGDQRTAEVLAKKAHAHPPSPQQQVAIFIRPQALTFPVAVGLVKVGWEGLKQLPFSWAGTNWVPFIACVFIGLLITIDGLINDRKLSLPMRVLGIVIGLLNSFVMFAAVLGISNPK